MQAEVAVPFSAYAAVEADEARRIADIAERRAFVNGYSHATATPAERERYVESVEMLYPRVSAKTDPIAARVLGGAIVFAFACAAIGGVVSWCRTGEASEGVMAGLAVVLGCIVAVGMAAVFSIGVALLFGWVC